MKNTETLISFDEVKKNRNIIVPRISEGNKSLENIINYCIDKNMPTLACCAGHNPFDKPYISMVYDKDTRRNINAFLNKLQNIKCEIMFQTTGFTNHPFCVVIYTNMLNRDKVFNIIENTINNDEKDEYIDKSLENALNIAIDMDYNGEYTTVNVLNKKFKRKYMIGLYKAIDGNIFEDYSDKIIDTDYDMTYYLYKTNEKVGLVAKDLEKLIPNIKYRNGFSISMDVDTNKKVDRISEFNKLLEEDYGKISRK